MVSPRRRIDLRWRLDIPLYSDGEVFKGWNRDVQMLPPVAQSNLEHCPLLFTRERARTSSHIHSLNMAMHCLRSNFRPANLNPHVDLPEYVQQRIIHDALTSQHRQDGRVVQRLGSRPVP